MRELRITLLFALGLVALGVVGIAVGALLKDSPDKQPAEPRAIHVSTATVARGSVTEQLRGFGVARPIREAAVSARVSGSITSVPAAMRVGAPVREGEVLAQIDRARYAAELARREALLAEARQTLASMTGELAEVERKVEITTREMELAASDLERAEQLFADAVLGEGERDAKRAVARQVESRLSDAKRAAISMRAMEQRTASNVAAREQEVELARLELDWSEVKAPFAGVLADRHIDQGDHVMVGAGLFRLVDLSAIELPIEIPASQAVSLKVGAEVRLLTDESPPREATGIVARVSPTISARNRTVGAWIIQERASGGEVFPPGSFLTSTIAGRTFDDVFAIPREAIVDGGIYLAIEGTAHRVEPDFFVILEELALTREELGAGSITLITSGFERLYEGAPIEVDTGAPAAPVLESGAAPSVAEASDAGAPTRQVVAQ